MNPFEDSDEDVYEFKDEDVCSVNPFAADLSYNFNPQRTSSLRNPKEKLHECHECEKCFGTKHNLKLHLIQVHRIRVPNMTVYTCSSCDFLTGSKVCLTRHKVTHSSKPNRKEGQAICNVCHLKVFNDQSLKRHKKRKHRKD